MAANIFKITGLNGSSNYAELWYKSDGKFYTAETGGTSYDGDSIGITVDTDKRNPDGTYTVTIGTPAIDLAKKTETSIQIEDVNTVDRQGFRLALDTTTLGKANVYGGNQIVDFSNDGGANLAITGINSGLLVNAAGTTISWTDATSTTANVFISNITGTGSWSQAIDVQGKTIFIGQSALSGVTRTCSR